MKILVAIGAGEVKDSFFTPEVIKELEQLGEIVWNETGNQAFTKEELIENIKDIDVIFTGWNSPKIDADVLEHANKLKVHAHTAGSVAPYTSKEEYERGIIVLCGNDSFARSVAEGCLCYTLNAARRNEEAMRNMREGKWKLDACWNSGLYKKKIGIVGYGTISRYYMDLLRWFEPDLYIYSGHLSQEDADKYGAKKATLEEIFSECDVISIHAAWNKSTEGMITKELLQMIKPGAVFVNTARAHVVDEVAMIEELKTGRFRAALDVYTVEPLPVDSELRSLTNVQLYPHMAGPTFDMRAQATLKLIAAIKHIEAGEEYGEGVSYDYAVRMTVK